MFQHKSSQKSHVALITTLVVAALLIGLLSIAAQGPLPGDVAITQALQQQLGSAPAWAITLTTTAKHPLVWLTLGLASFLAWLRSRWYGLAATVITFIAVKATDFLLRAFIYVPKPTPELVDVASSSSSSGLPSTFVLVYGALFSSVLIGKNRAGWGPNIAALIAILLLTMGLSARLVLGGHWFSQVAASLLLAWAFSLLAHKWLKYQFPANSW